MKTSQIPFINTLRDFIPLKQDFLYYRWPLSLGLFCLLIVDFLQLAVPIVIKKAVDDLTYNRITNTSLIYYALIILIIALGIAVLRYFWRFFVIGTSRRIEERLRNRLFQHLQTLSYFFFQRTKTGDIMARSINDIMAVRMATGMGVVSFEENPVGRLVTRVTNDIENLNEMFKSVLVTVFKDIFILGGVLVILLYINWRLAVTSFIVLPFIFVFTFLFSSLMRDAFREIREKVAKLNVFQQERFSGIRIIQLFAGEVRQMDNFRELNHENFMAEMRQIKLFAVFVPVMELFSSFAIALIIWHGGGKVVSEQLSLGALVAFISYIQMFFKPIRDISEKYNIMQLAMASTERIFESMDKGKADKVIVMHKGRICEQGSHEELMTKGGIYYKLNKLREYSD